MRKTISARVTVMMMLAALLACIAPYGADVCPHPAATHAPFDSIRAELVNARTSLRTSPFDSIHVDTGMSLRTSPFDSGLVETRPSLRASLVAAEGEAPAIVHGDPVSPSDVVPELLAVRARWRSAGVPAEDLRKLDSLSIEITDLPGAMLAEARGSSIVIDRTAAGWGWFVDPTPLDDAEFDAGAATAGAAGKIDLLTTIVHEMLHTLGRADLDPSRYSDDVMAGSLPRGVRRLTSTRGASANVIAPAFTLPAGRSVTITLDAVIAKPFPVGVGQVSLQGSISADTLATVVSDDPSTAAVNDPTITAVSCPVVTVGPASIGGVTAGQAYSQTFTQSGGPGVVTFAASGPLPAGLTLNSATGVLSGTPTQTGSFTFTVTATSENGCSVGMRSYTLQVACPVITVAPGTLPTAIIQHTYGPIVFTPTGGIGTTTLALTGTLPPGLTFTASTRTLSGIPTDPGSFTFTITATDQNGCTGARTYTLLAGGARIITTGADVLVPPWIRRYTSGDGLLVPGPTGNFTPNPFGFSQGVRVAEADMTGDGVPDILAASGHGVPPRVFIYDGVTGAQVVVRDVGPQLDRGGVFVAAGDVDGDGKPDIVTGAGDNQPLVQVFSGASGVPLWTMFAYPLTFKNGARVAAGDVNGDGFADVITGSGFGDPGIVKVFSGASHAELRSITPYPGFVGGIYVAAGDVNGDGYADVITGAGQTGGPHVRVFDGRTGAVLLEFFAYAPTFLGGVRVAAGDVNGDGKADIITAPGAGGDGAIRIFDGATGTPIGSPIMGQAPATEGLFVGTAVPENRMVIDAPAADANLGHDFRISGWAFQEGAPGTGVDAVHVWAQPVPVGTAVFLGAATLGDARPDVGTIFGPRYAPSGYHLDVTGLADGRYDLVVSARNSATGVFNTHRTVRVRVRTPGHDIRVTVALPHAGTVHRNFRVAGSAWDADAIGGGSGVDAVHVWAQPVAGGAPIFLGAAVLGDPRPYPGSDPGSGAGSRVIAVAPIGYHLDVTGMNPADYVITVSAKAAVRADFTATETLNVTVAASPPALEVSIDTPRVGLQPGAAFTVAGWALTVDAPTTPGVDAVHVWAYPVAGGTATFLGAATFGGARPDIVSLYGPAYESSGFSLSVPNLPSGTWDIAVFARTTGAPAFGAPKIVRITVP